MIVIDASALIEYLLWTPKGQTVVQKVSQDTESLHAPHLIDLEVAQTLCRMERQGALSARRAGRAIVDLADLRIVRYPHEVLLPRIWKLRKNVSAYDAAYISLAEALSAPLLTGDRRLASAPGHRAVIELL